MNKRQLKKLMQYDILDAIELAIAKYPKSEDASKLDETLDALLNLFDASVTKVARMKKESKDKNVKKYVREILSEYNTEVAKIFK